MAQRCSPCALRPRRWRRRDLALAIPLALLAVSATSRGIGFAGPARPRPRCRGASPALAARGGEDFKEALGLQGEISAKRAIGELDMLLQHVFKPHPLKQASLVEWTRELKQEPSKTVHQAFLKIVPLNRTFHSGWKDSGAKARDAAAQSALGLRLGNNELGDVQGALSHILRNALGGDDISIETEGAADKWRAALQLPARLFPAGCPPDKQRFEGKGSNKQEVKQSAAWKALLFLCASIGTLPALQALGGRTRTPGSMVGRGSSTVLFGNFNPEASEQSIRERFEQFGKVTAFELKKGKSRSKGSATYEHKLSAWVAPRIMDRSPIDDHVVYVTQRAAQVNVPGRSQPQRSWGKATSPDSVLFYNNAPFKESFSSMLSRFREVAEVKSFRYWVDEETQESRGRGTIGFASARAAQEALERMQGMEIDGRKLEVEFYKKHETAVDA
mmetsp:Transcript_5551/g.14772  ORF Transcript_5551/g.14772 Transcript_5551/m.14772 type:complete len:446 (-) Transcript_5551:33-1370(-)